MQPIIKEVVSKDKDDGADPDSLIVEVFDTPPFREYVCCIESHLQTREALAIALQDCAYA